jgi:dynein heavy chain
LVEADREKFSEFLRNTSQLILPSSSLYDNFFNIDNLKFMRWEEKVPAYEAPHDRKFSSILVPTVDTVRYAWLMGQVMSLKKPAMYCGDSGTAKTVTVNSGFRTMEEKNKDEGGKHMFLNINFSSRTNSFDFQQIVEENIDKRTFKTYGPKASGKTMVVFIDDLNMPKIDVYGTQ